MQTFGFDPGDWQEEAWTARRPLGEYPFELRFARPLSAAEKRALAEGLYARLDRSAAEPVDEPWIWSGAWLLLSVDLRPTAGEDARDVCKAMRTALGALTLPLEEASFLGVTERKRQSRDPVPAHEAPVWPGRDFADADAVTGRRRARPKGKPAPDAAFERARLEALRRVEGPFGRVALEKRAAASLPPEPPGPPREHEKLLGKGSWVVHQHGRTVGMRQKGDAFREIAWIDDAGKLRKVAWPAPLRMLHVRAGGDRVLVADEATLSELDLGTARARPLWSTGGDEQPLWGIAEILRGQEASGLLACTSNHTLQLLEEGKRGARVLDAQLVGQCDWLLACPRGEGLVTIGTGDELHAFAIADRRLRPYRAPRGAFESIELRGDLLIATDARGQLHALSLRRD